MPSNAPLLLALALIVVLVVSALAKRADPASTRSVTVLLRLPTFLHHDWFAKTLPLAELALVVGLIAPWTPLALFSWAVATVLFAIYLAIIVRAMTFTPRPSCGCFGQIGNQRVTGHTVVRNALLLASSVLVLAWVSAGHTVPTAVVDLDREGWAWVLSAATAVAIAVLIVGSPTSTRTPRRTARGAEGTVPTQEADPSDYIRTPNPTSLLISPDGDPVLLDLRARQAAQLVLFLAPGDEATSALAPRVPQWAARLIGVDTVVAMGGSRSAVAENHPDLVPFAFVDPFFRATAQVVGHGPAAVLLGADGLLAGGPVHGVAEITNFVEEVLDQLGDAPSADADNSVASDAR